MAHYCPRCAMKCHCNGDIDDLVFDDNTLCCHCDDDDDCENDYEGNEDDFAD